MKYRRSCHGVESADHLEGDVRVAVGEGHRRLIDAPCDSSNLKLPMVLCALRENTSQFQATSERRDESTSKVCQEHGKKDCR